MLCLCLRAFSGEPMWHSSRCSSSHFSLHTSLASLRPLRCHSVPTVVAVLEQGDVVTKLARALCASAAKLAMDHQANLRAEEEAAHEAEKAEAKEAAVAAAREGSVRQLVTSTPRGEDGDVKDAGDGGKEPPAAVLDTEREELEAARHVLEEEEAAFTKQLEELHARHKAILQAKERTFEAERAKVEESHQVTAFPSSSLPSPPPFIPPHLHPSSLLSFPYSPPTHLPTVSLPPARRGVMR